MRLPFAAAAAGEVSPGLSGGLPFRPFFPFRPFPASSSDRGLMSSAAPARCLHRQPHVSGQSPLMPKQADLFGSGDRPLDSLLEGHAVWYVASTSPGTARMHLFIQINSCHSILGQSRAAALKACTPGNNMLWSLGVPSNVVALSSLQQLSTVCKWLAHRFAVMPGSSLLSQASQQ